MKKSPPGGGLIIPGNRYRTADGVFGAVCCCVSAYFI